MRELVAKRRGQAPPGWVLWEALVDPATSGVRSWLHLLADERMPTVLEQHRPDLVVWSSLWPDRPHDQVRFDIESEADRSGCSVRLSLWTDADDPTPERLAEMRHRVSFLVNGALRATFDQ